ncbi:MAG: Ig-like domain-containing protein [Anaerolineae bacterium]
MATDTAQPPRLHLTPFDRVVIVVMALLVVLIGATVLLGDRVGVQLSSVAPLGEAHSTSAITIRFSEAMNHDSATAHFRTDPALPGAFSWSGTALTFKPDAALQPGGEYTVYLEPGALSETGRAVLSEYRYSFTVQQPRVAYLYPANDTPQNVWIADPADPENAEQVTHSPSGVEDFGVSPDGTKIAFTENNNVLGTSDIKLIELATGGLEQLTNCQNALCSAPVWRPDGKVIAYQRIENDAQFGSSPPRVWLLDLTTTPATTRPLFQENQILGYDAEWSADGNRIALVNRSTASILVYDFTTDKIVSVNSQAGITGALSPDGKTLIYPDLVFPPEGGSRETLRSFTIDAGEFATITDPADPIWDHWAEWSPDGKTLAIARENTNTRDGAQVILLDTITGETRSVTDDARYTNMFFRWDPTGTALVAQRVPELDANGQPNPRILPEIWTLNVVNGEQKLIAANGFLPQWVP